MANEIKHLTEQQRHLFGISPREFGGLPAMFQMSTFEQGVSPKPQPRPPSSPRPPRAPLEERSMQLFQDVKTMRSALERAHKLVARVNASIHTDRESSRSPVNEKYRAEMYRLDQEIASALDSIRAANEALCELDTSRRRAEKEAKEQRRHSR